jgi:hypothetical protein
MSLKHSPTGLSQNPKPILSKRTAPSQAHRPPSRPSKMTMTHPASVTASTGTCRHRTRQNTKRYTQRTVTLTATLTSKRSRASLTASISQTPTFDLPGISSTPRRAKALAKTPVLLSSTFSTNEAKGTAFLAVFRPRCAHPSRRRT